MGTAVRTRVRSLVSACLVAVLLAACTLNPAPEPTPRMVTTTPVVTQGAPTLTTTPVPQLATRAPTDTPVLTTPCAPRPDWFIYTAAAGDTLAGVALRAGITVEAATSANCLNADVPLSADQPVRVPIALLPPPTATESAVCTERWFFVFRPGKSEVTASCPTSPIQFDALGQDFEGGRVYRVPAGSPLPNASAEYPSLIVVYNNGFWQMVADTWQSGQPSMDEAITAPLNRAQPTDGIGLLWRGDQAVRTALGWAYAPAAPFVGRVQFPQGRNDYWYIDHGTARLALRLSVSQYAPNPWEIAGEY